MLRVANFSDRWRQVAAFSQVNRPSVFQEALPVHAGPLRSPEEANVLLAARGVHVHRHVSTTVVSTAIARVWIQTI